MEFKEEVFSNVLNITDYNAGLVEIIEILSRHQCKEVEILFGFAWGNRYKNWTPFNVPVHQVAHEIQLAGQSGEGGFGDDDFYIIINELQMEILFCHESDIHLLYNQSNPIIEEVLKCWTRDGLIRATKTNSNYDKPGAL